MRICKIIPSIVLAAAAAISCSTTKVLQDDQYRLSKNKIEVTNDKHFNINQLQPYIKQKPNSYFILGWNPFLNVYNWSNGKGKAWDRLVQKIGVAPVVYDSEMVESSISNMESHLKYLGYFDSDVESQIKVRRKKVKVTYLVTLGKQFPIEEFVLELPERGEFRNDFLRDSSAITIRKGDFLSEASLEAETERASKLMRDQGYYTFNKNHFFFEADTLNRPGRALLKMTVNEYTRNESPLLAQPIRKFFFNNVTVSYPKSMNVKEKVLRELNTIKPGTQYDPEIVNNTYTRLSALRMFSSVNIGMTQIDTNLVDCEISLAQSKTQGFKVNLEGSSNSSGLLGISPQLSYYHKNIFRGGEWLNLSFMGNFQFKLKDDIRSNEFGVSAGLSFPKFFPLPYRFFEGAIPRTEINLSYNYQDRPEYTRNILSTTYGYNGDLGNKFFYQAYPLQLNVVKLLNLDPEFYETLADDPFLRNAYQDHFDLGSGMNLYYTTNAESVPKETYFYSRLQFDIAGNMLSLFKPIMKTDESGAGMLWNTPFSQFVRAELTLGRTWVFGRNNGQSVATRLVTGAGYAYGNSEALPFEKHFYGGGANSLRGWQVRTVGPGTAPMDDSFVIPNQTGDMKLEANVEYRFKMFWKVAGALFVDAGNIWTLKDDGSESGKESMFAWNRLGESLAMNWGAGLRMDFNFLILRLDLGMKIHDPARVNKWVGPDQWLKRDGYALHFGVGYPF